MAAPLKRLTVQERYELQKGREEGRDVHMYPGRILDVVQAEFERAQIAQDALQRMLSDPVLDLVRDVLSAIANEYEPQPSPDLVRDVLHRLVGSVAHEKARAALKTLRGE